MSPQFDNQNQEIGIDILLYNIRISYHFCQLSHVAKKLLEKSILVQDPIQDQTLHLAVMFHLSLLI